jgi:hypothetical protein
MADRSPRQPPSQGLPQVLQNVGTVVTIMVAVVGLIGSILGYFATFKSNANAADIQVLQQQFDEAEKFASDIHSDSADMSRRNSNVQAMIAYVSLYAASNNIDRKFLIVETAQAAKDTLSLGVLGQLMDHDLAVQKPSPDDADKAAAIRAALKSSSSAAYNASAERPLPKNYHDVDLSTIAKQNPLAAANGQVVAALTKENLQAWVFIGDVPNANSNAMAPLSGDYIQPTSVPAVHATVTTRTALNLRSFPWANGRLGDIVGVAPIGTQLETIEPARRHLYRHGGGSGATWQAIWIHVIVSRK